MSNLISCAGDYDSILGTKIPYQALGYSSLESLLRAVPNVRITQIGRDIFIDDKPDENTKHIANFVRDQKCSKKKSRVGYLHSLFFFVGC